MMIKRRSVLKGLLGAVAGVFGAKVAGSTIPAKAISRSRVGSILTVPRQDWLDKKVPLEPGQGYLVPEKLRDQIVDIMGQEPSWGLSLHQDVVEEPPYENHCMVGFRQYRAGHQWWQGWCVVHGGPQMEKLYKCPEINIRDWLPQDDPDACRYSGRAMVDTVGSYGLPEQNLIRIEFVGIGDLVVS